ncbi:glycosyltransferase family 4 protein [Cyclobacterium jeungdonense]|uniref:Glycosyltransferase family 4 protein n=1 Tax=Cyclobacterium jeungdonense TaxID=708087 RepID=A0ABT8CAR0_9BACT|nr:glycosyltransferase family 4 protein [Cyclobacterium jeungdonense]MDN3689481.1 glycosyltransferase family 4 protein [Cyclobacterium jeungdonense]
MRTIVIQAWTVHKLNSQYFLPYTHWVYIKEFLKYFDKVCLLSPTKIHSKSFNQKEFFGFSNSDNVEIYELPYSEGYIGAIKFFPYYIKAYSKLKSFDFSYVRYPIPFGWLQSIFFRNKNKIIHFVGDPIDTFKNNPNLSTFRRLIYTFFFLPEHWMYMLACRNAKVFTNGFHLAKKLQRYNVSATPLVSSTLIESDFYFDDHKKVENDKPKLVYVGYLRKAKGVDIIIRSFSIVQSRFPLAELTIVGEGELEDDLKILVKTLQLKNVYFTGHIGCRSELNEIFRCNDIFCFASLSEGSPRVILEAMANGLNIVSTPVGSLPDIFENGKEILFADYNDVNDFVEKIFYLINNPKFCNKLRTSAYVKVKDFTVQNFIEKLFYEI